MRQIALKPQDIVVALKIALIGSGKRTFAHLANELAMPASEVHASTHRSKQAGIITTSLGDGLSIIKPALREFLVHGVRYAFPAVFGGIARGVPTASGGPSLQTVVQTRGKSVGQQIAHRSVREQSGRRHSRRLLGPRALRGEHHIDAHWLLRAECRGG